MNPLRLPARWPWSRTGGANRAAGLQRRARAALVAALLAATSPGTTFGCGYHVAIAGGISTAHAASIPVALAVHAAIDSGRLTPVTEAPAPLALVRANGAIRMFAAGLAQDAAAMPPIAIVLVEAHLWSRIVPESGAAQVQFHADGPASGDVIVVTGEPALRALLDGRLSWDTAIATGLVVVDGPDAGRQRLARVLAQRAT